MNEGVIDVHTHWCPPLGCGIASWTKSHSESYWHSLFSSPDPLMTFPCADEFLSDMDAAGVSRAVIQGIFWQGTEACRAQNAGVSKFLERRPDRISAFAAINPADIGGSLKTISEVRGMGFCGVGELCDAVQDFSYSDSGFDEIVCACAEEKLCICVHLNDNESPEYPGKFLTGNRAFYGLAARRPEAVFIAAHFGGCDILRGLVPTPNIFFDSAAAPLFYKPDIWALAAEKYPQNVLFGSDYAMRLYPERQKKADFSMILEEGFANVPEPLHEAFFCGNAQRAVDF